MRVLITGGSGFVGLAVAEAVLQQGSVPILLADRPPPPRLYAALGTEVAVRLADIRDAAAVASVIREAAPTHVVHGAALTPSPDTEVDVAEALLAVNLGGTATLLKQVAAAGISRVLLLSSGAVYGPVDAGSVMTLQEDRVPAPVTLYGISKFAGEMVAARLAEQLGLDLVIARLGPVYGPFEHGTGVRPLMSPHLQLLCDAAAGRTSILPWRLAADWVYSRDVAQGILGLLRLKLGEQRAVETPVFNVGSGTISDLLGWAAALSPHFPNWTCHTAGPDESPTVRYGLGKPRPPLDVLRIRRLTDYSSMFDQASSASDYLNWFNRHQH